MQSAGLFLDLVIVNESMSALFSIFLIVLEADSEVPEP
jgi:hypothetical protein